MRHAIIMAGGVGTRLWPISRKSAPKQFQKLTGDRTLIQQTYDRIRAVLPASNIWVMTGDDYKDITAEQLPEINPDHILTEPSARNTTAATALATLRVLQEDPEAILFGLLPADHHVGKPKIFTKTVEAIFDFLEAKPEYVATIGIHPTEANTGLGYIKIGEKLGSHRGKPVLAVESFHEKPDAQTAETFIESGQYLWNGGYYLFNGAQMIEYYRQLQPEMLASLEQFIADPANSQLYNTIESISIDKGISEKLSKLAVVPADMEWSDIGNWAALHEILAEQGKTSEVATGDHIGNGTENSLIMGGHKLIVTVGIKDVVVIDTEDVILICNRDTVQDVKKIVEKLEEQGRSEFL